MTAILVVDGDEKRAEALGRRLRDAGADSVHVESRRGDAGSWTILPEMPEAISPDVVFRHYRDADVRATSAPLEIWYGGAGPETGRVGLWHVFDVVGLNAVEKWPVEWIAEIVAWATLLPETRQKASVPLLLQARLAKVLLAYHLLGLAKDTAAESRARLRRARLKDEALSELRLITGASFDPSVLDCPASLRTVLVRHLYAGPATREEGTANLLWPPLALEMSSVGHDCLKNVYTSLPEGVVLTLVDTESRTRSVLSRLAAEFDRAFDPGPLVRHLSSDCGWPEGVADEVERAARAAYEDRFCPEVRLVRLVSAGRAFVAALDIWRCEVESAGVGASTGPLWNDVSSRARELRSIFDDPDLQMRWIP